MIRGLECEASRKRDGMFTFESGNGDGTQVDAGSPKTALHAAVSDTIEVGHSEFVQQVV